MILTHKNGLSFYQFPNFMNYPEFFHGIFTRNGGVSNGSFQTLNVSFDVGDDPLSVKENRDAVLKCAGGKDLIYLRQIHGSDVIIVTPDGENSTTKGFESPLSGDALSTDMSGVLLLIKAADCQPVLLYDPVKKVIANIHSGWKGSIQNIIGRTVKTLNHKFKCRSHDILVGVGPSLGPCCGEFINYKQELPEEFWEYKDDDNHFDFWAISRDQLLSTGVLDKNIFISKICTKCHTDQFFSYRNEGTTGRFAAVIGLL